jgi:hypothetical protein
MQAERHDEDLGRRAPTAPQAPTPWNARPWLLAVAALWGGVGVAAWVMWGDATMIAPAVNGGAALLLLLGL